MQQVESILSPRWASSSPKRHSLGLAPFHSAPLFNLSCPFLSPPPPHVFLLPTLVRFFLFSLKGCLSFFFLIYFYLWLCWVFVSVRGLSPVAASGGHSSSRCAGLSLSRPLLLRSAGSVIVAHRPSCSASCGTFPDQGSNPCPLHWQADSQPLHHQGSPSAFLLLLFFL